MNVTPGVIASPATSLLTDFLTTSQCLRAVDRDSVLEMGSANAIPLTMATLPTNALDGMAHNDLSGVTMTFILAALLLSLLTIGHVVASHVYAYNSAPSEFHTFLDAANSSIAENESFDHDIMRLQPSDRPRLIKLLDSIQKCGDDLRENLNRLTVDGTDTKLRTQSLLLWKTHRDRLETQLRRLDLLRMRFLTLHMGLLAHSTATHPHFHNEKAGERRAPEGQFPRPAMPKHALTDTLQKIKEKGAHTEKKPSTPQRSMSAARTGHNMQDIAKGPQFSMASVISELQSSPKLHMRRASIERRTSVPMSPSSMGSPTSRERPMSPMSPLSGSGWRFDNEDT